MAQKILIFKNFYFFIFFFIFTYSAYGEIISGKAKVIDGDTISINSSKIRLHGIDAPELDQKCLYEKKQWSCGQDSKYFLKNLIYKNILNCKTKGKDKYKRYIAVCYLEDININQELVKSGWAIAYKYYSKDYIKDEKIAKDNKNGIWQGEFIEPYIYRKNNK